MRPILGLRFVAGAISAALVHILGCGESTAPPSAIGPGEVQTQATSLRIASLSPAVTRTLVDLGLGPHIVGRTPFCDAVDPGVPVVGSLLDLDFEGLHAVRPTHVLVQPSASGIDPGLASVALTQGWHLASWRLNRLADIEAMLGELPSVLLAAGADRDELARRTEGLAMAVRALHAAPPAPAAPRVLLAVSVDPISAAGSDTFLSELLEGTGRRNAVTAKGYPELSLEDLVAIDPDAVILLRERTIDAAEAERLLSRFRRAGQGSVGRLKVAIMASPDAMLPSSSAPKVAAELARVLAEIGLASEPAPAAPMRELAP